MTYIPKIPAGFCLIDEACKVSGTNPSALRMWELRYGWPMPERVEGGQYRIYPRSLLPDLKRIVELAHSGIPISTLIKDGQPVTPPRHTGDVARLRALLRQAQAALLDCGDPMRAFGARALAERQAVVREIQTTLARADSDCECTPVGGHRVLPPTGGQPATER